MENLSLPLYDSEIINHAEFIFHVNAVHNTSDIRGIIVDEKHMEIMKELSKEMKIYFNTNDLEPPQIKEEEFYAVYDDHKINQWQRVKCLRYYENQMADLYFIDRGDEDIFAIDRLQILPKQFNLPMQSIKLTLWDLEIFNDCEEINQFMSSILVGSNVKVKVMSFIFQEKDTPLISVIVSMINESEKISVNDLILNHIIESRITNPENFLKPDEFIRANVSYLSDTEIFIQIKSKGLTYFNKLMHSLSEKYLDNKYYKLHHTSIIDPEKVYLAKNLENHCWYRVKIFEVNNENEVTVVFIDFGKLAIIHKNNLVLLESLSKFLVHYPAQAIQVFLDKISPFDFTKYLRESFGQLIYKPGSLFIKNVGVYKNQPVVQFYKLFEQKSVSVNEELFDELLFKSSPIFQMSVSELPLPLPSIPEDGSYFDVFVGMVANLDDIVIQPLSHIFQLKNFMAHLLDACEEFSGPHLGPDDIRVGGIYAVMDYDDTWFRGCVTKIITETRFVVYACDYGEYKYVKLANLQPLQREFYNFPYQAIKCRLVGILPEVKKNWNLNDSVKLEELILNKRLVSHVISREIDISVGFKKIVLNLKLYDTDTEEDVNISDIVNNFNKEEQ